jgi:hypothetical protein
LLNGVELSGGRLLVEDVNGGTVNGGAATDVPMLVQPTFVGGGVGFANMLRSTGVTGVESQLDVGGGDGVPELVGQGGGARLLLVFEFAGGAAGCVAKGLVDCEEG